MLEATLLCDMNLTELLDSAASRWPGKPALIEGDTVVSYAELVELVAVRASQLQSLQLSPGGRVGLCFPNGLAHVVLTYALWRVNAVVVPIPVEGTAEELSDLAETMQLEAILSEKNPGLAVPLPPDCFFTRLTPAEPADNHGLNLAFIRFTSGTTSARKGVALCHETIRDRIRAANQAMRIGPADTVVWCLPMAHHFLSTIVLYLSEGAAIVLARHVLARPFLEAVNRWRGTVLYAAPFHFALLARDDSGAQLPSVRLAVSTTCALPRDVAEDFHRRFGRPLTQVLGIIELGLVSMNTEDPLGRWDSVGRLLPDYRARILNPDENGCGEVALAGPGFFDAYVAPWVPRDRVLRDGWFCTGDIGRLDEDGFLMLVGRKTAVINLAGRKVFPEEIEAVLNRHPAVRESRVFGRAHPHLGEVVEAELVLARPDIDLQEIRDFCRANLASFKVPTRLHLLTALPRTAVTGKLRRTAAVGMA
jgi:long-chain acyl-CoA synthetase